MPGTTTTPPRPQIAESLSAQLEGVISPVRFEHSEFQTWRMRPVAASIDDDVPLVRRRVADVAAGRGQDAARASS